MTKVQEHIQNLVEHRQMETFLVAMEHLITVSVIMTLALITAKISANIEAEQERRKRINETTEEQWW
jgi:hypothetical protein